MKESERVFGRLMQWVPCARLL